MSEFKYMTEEDLKFDRIQCESIYQTKRVADVLEEINKRLKTMGDV